EGSEATTLGEEAFDYSWRRHHHIQRERGVERASRVPRRTRDDDLQGHLERSLPGRPSTLRILPGSRITDRECNYDQVRRDSGHREPPQRRDDGVIHAW